MIVVLFGGTDEGHKIADFLSEQKVSYIDVRCD